MTEIPYYICHKRVQAREISSMEVMPRRIDNPVGNILFNFRDGGPSLKIPDWGDPKVSRYMPVSGDFLVIYEDGYQSFSPRKAFLEGYTAASEQNVLMERLNDLANAGPGVAPLWLQGDGWVHQIARVAREAYVTINSLKHQVEHLRRTENRAGLLAEIGRLQALLRRCQHGADIVDLGNGETIALNLKEEENGKTDQA